MASLSSSVTGAFEIPFLLSAVYYWSVYRPTLIPVWFVFVLGVVLDLMSGMPVGMSSFVLIFVRLIVTDQRLFLASQSFPAVWIGFVFVCVIANAFQWLFFGLIEGQWTGPLPVLAVIGLGSCIYPFLSAVLYLSHKVLPGLSDHYGVVK